MTDIYAFALSPNDIIRPETLAEKIDRMCAEARAEIADMARKALEELCPPYLTPRDSQNIELFNREKVAYVQALRVDIDALRQIRPGAVDYVWPYSGLQDYRPSTLGDIFDALGWR